MFTTNQLAIVRFCAEECKRQRSGEVSVSNMVNAYNRAEFLFWNKFPLTEMFILELGAWVEPERNEQGYRQTPVTFANGGRGLDANLIIHTLVNLVTAARQGRVSPEEFYKEFETIHPFIDGNGRVGSILYNLLKETLDNPVVPPAYW